MTLPRLREGQSLAQGHTAGQFASLSCLPCTDAQQGSLLLVEPTRVPAETLVYLVTHSNSWQPPPPPRHQQFGSQELLSALSKHLQEEKWSHCQYQKPDLNPPKRIDFSGQSPFSRARGSRKSCQSERVFPSSYLLLPSEGVCAPIWVDWPVASALSPNHPALPT